MTHDKFKQFYCHNCEQHTALNTLRTLPSGEILAQCNFCDELYVFDDEGFRTFLPDSIEIENGQRKSDAKVVMLDEIAYQIAELGKSLNKVLCEISAGIGALTYKIDHLVLWVVSDPLSKHKEFTHSIEFDTRRAEKDDS